MITKEKLMQWMAECDRRLKKIVGEENEILFHFVRLALVAVVFALLVGMVVWIVTLVFHAISLVIAAFLVALPYLLAILLIAGIAALAIYVYRLKHPQRRSANETHPDPQGPAVSQARPVARTTDEGGRVEQSLRAADQQTRNCLQAVLASLQRFDHRLELPISPAHYNDIFGDNWVAVREFVESSQGKGVPEVATLLVELIILYKRAQDARWVPINHDRIHAWWGEAARRRKWLSDIAEATATGPVSADAQGDVREPSAAAAHSVPPSLDELLRYYDRLSRNP
jgi:hypothetical protein